MKKRFYTDFTEHCMRFYVTSPDIPPDFRSSADKENWMACRDALKEFKDDTQKTLVSIFSDKRPISDCISDYVEKTGTKSDTIWYLVRELERQIAEKRGLK